MLILMYRAIFKNLRPLEIVNIWVARVLELIESID